MQKHAQPENPSRRALLTGRVSTRPEIAVIGDTCLAHRNIVCRSCSESCEAGAIRFQLAAGSAGLPLVATDLCTGCGDCAPVCPASAIAIQPAPTIASASAEAAS